VTVPDLRLPQPRIDELAEGENGLREQAALSAGVDLNDREKLNALNSLGRSDQKEVHLHRCTVVGIYTVTVACAIMFFVLVSQYILPDRYRFLTGEEQEKLQNFLFSGAIGGLLTGAISKVGGRTSEPKK
jgi:hypothetical protein